MTRSERLFSILLAGAILAPAAAAQSLFLAPPAPVPLDGERMDPAASLYGVSLIAVQPPKPREFQIHDLVTIIIDETSRQEAEQSLKTDKKYDLSADLKKFPSIRHLLEFQLQNGDDQSPASLGLGSNQKFDGKGEYERTDRFSAKVTAEIIDVKPNGTLVLEARKHIKKDEEEQTLVLSGKCRLEDVTSNNTILSSQLADLTLVSKNDGQLKDSGTKGWIPRILETLFAF